MFINNKTLDKKKKTYDERSKHIEENLNKESLQEKLRTEIAEHGTIDNTYLGEYLDRMANYILESDDLESGRKLEHSYYQGDKDYRSHFAIGKNTVPVEPEDLDYIKQETGESLDPLNKNYLRRLFDPQKLTKADLRRFIISMSNYTNNYTNLDSEELTGAVNWLKGEIKSCCTDKEWEIIKEFQKTNKIKNIARNKQITSQAVSYFLKNIVKKVEKSLHFAL